MAIGSIALLFPSVNAPIGPTCPKAGGISMLTAPSGLMGGGTIQTTESAAEFRSSPLNPA
jgi:hypothetical protein